MPLPGLDKLAGDIAAATSANDPTAVLFAEHEWTRLVLDEFRDRDKDAVRLTSTEVDELAKFLDLHIRREEEAYFPALEHIAQEMGLGSTSDMYGEHDAIRIRLEELQEAIPRTADLASHLAALRRSLLVHFDNEEELLFYEPASRLTEDARRDILAGFERL